MSFSITAACIGCAACAKACPVSAIAGERKGLHRIDPLKCIECGACGRVCPKAAVLDDRGVPIPKLARAEWERPAFDLSRCIACGACEAKCPASCITLREGKDGGLETWPFLAAPEACVSCGYCAFYCPMSCIRLEPPKAADPAKAAAPQSRAGASDPVVREVTR